MSSPSMWSRRQMLAERGSDFPPAVDSAQLDFPAGHETEEQNQRRVFAWQRTSRLYTAAEFLVEPLSCVCGTTLSRAGGQG